MFDVFSTREVATAIWILVILTWLLRDKNVRKSFRDLLGTLCNRVLILPFLCLLLYTSVIVYGLHFVPFWDWVLIKDVILWVLFVATPITYKAASKKGNDYPFTKMLKDNFLWSAILEFFISSFTFNVFVELLVILPGFNLLAILKDYNRDDPEHKKVQKIYDGMAVVAGLVLLWCTADVAINDIKENGFLDVLISFCIPIIFSIAFLPVVYFLAVKALYHDLFVLIQIRNKGNDDLLSLKKRKVFLACWLSYRKIQKFRKAYTTQYIGKVCFGNDDNTFLSFVERIKKGNYENELSNFINGV